MTQSAAPDLVTVPRENIAEALTQACEYFENRADVVDGDYGIPEPNTEMRLAQMCSDALSAIPSSDPEGGARGEMVVQGSIATKQESCPESAPRTETAFEYGSIEDRIADATRDAAESHKEDCNSYGAGYDSGYLAALIELRDDQLTKTPSADHDAGNLRGLAEPNHQPHAVSQGWRTDLENAPGGVRFLIAARYPNGIWYVEESYRHYAGHFNGRKIDPPTHWMPLPAPPSPAKTGGAE